MKPLAVSVAVSIAIPAIALRCEAKDGRRGLPLQDAEAHPLWGTPYHRPQLSWRW